MASLPEDDGPTMVGAPGEQRAPDPVSAGSQPDDPGPGAIDDTTSALVAAPAAPPPPPATELPSDALLEDVIEENDERTVQQAVPPDIAAAAARAAAKPARNPLLIAPTTPSNPPVPGKAPAMRPKAASSTDTNVTDTPRTEADVDDDSVEDSITATAPRLNAANLMAAAQSGRGVPLSIPGRIEIRTLEEDEDAGDETEVRTRPGHGSPEGPPLRLQGAALPVPRPAAGRPPEAVVQPLLDDDDEPDEDGVTTQALAPRVGSAPDLSRAPSAPARAEIFEEPATRPGVVDEADELLTRPGLGGESEPPTSPGLAEPATRPGLGDPSTVKVERKPDGYANDEDEDDSVTTRAPAAEPYGEDSVTTQAPNVPLDLIHAAIKAAEAAADMGLDDTSAASTQKVKKPRVAATGLPADEEAESITTQAPGHVTNMLRVIASGSSPDLGKKVPEPLDEDEGPENRTAVMANAPLKRVIAEAESVHRLPAIRPTGGPLSHGPMGAAAPRLEPSSESGMRVARAPSGSNERASLGQLLAAGDGRSSMAPMQAHPGDMALQPMQSMHDGDLNKGPSYGLLVAVVAVVSLAVPVLLFVVLNRGGDPVTPGAPAAPASELEKSGTPRGKSPRGKNGLTIVPSAAASPTAVTPAPSAAPSASASGKPGGKGFPFRR